MQCSLDPGTENNKLPSNLDIPSSVAAASLILVALSKPEPRKVLTSLSGAMCFRGRVIQYSTSFSPFSAISFWKYATILSRRAITPFTSSLVR